MAANTTPRSTENQNPEKFANFLVTFAENPDWSVRKVARACGVPHGTAQQIVQRIETRYQPVLNEVKRATTPGLVKTIEELLPKLLDIPDGTIKDATLRDRMVAAGIMIEKRQLLMGEPTQILSLEQRRSMSELLPALQAEIKKRALTIDAEFEDVTPQETGA